MSMNRRSFFGALAATLAASVVGVAPALSRRVLRSVPFDRAAALRAVVIYPPEQPQDSLCAVAKVASFAELTTVWGKTHHAIVAGTMVMTDCDSELMAARVENAKHSSVMLFEDACACGYWTEPNGKRIPFTAIKFITA